MGTTDDFWAIVGHAVTGSLISLGATVGSYIVQAATQIQVWDPSLNLKVILLMVVIAFLKGIVNRLEPEVPVATGAKAKPKPLKGYFGI